MAKEERIRVNVTLTGELARAFEAELSKTLATNATLARVAIEHYLQGKGYNIEGASRWGGARKPKSQEESEGQRVAVA